MFSEFSSCICRRDNASLAKSSSPFARANCARRCQSSAFTFVCSRCVSMRLNVAAISAYDCLTRMRSLCISSTACSMIFSGSSNLLNILFILEVIIRTNLPTRFIDGSIRCILCTRRGATGITLKPWNKGRQKSPTIIICNKELSMVTLAAGVVVKLWVRRNNSITMCLRSQSFSVHR